MARPELDGVLPALPTEWMPPSYAVVEIWQQLQQAEALLARVTVEAESLMSDERFYEILAQPSMASYSRRPWRILPPPVWTVSHGRPGT